jgi:hypothetical protein
MGTRASKFLKTKRITTKMMYKTYIKTYPNSLIAQSKNYNLFKTIVTESHKEAVEECLKGGQYHFGDEIGLLEVNKFERKFRVDKDGKVLGMAVDFGATRKNKAAGNPETIYHTNPVIFKWKWNNKPKTGWLLAVTDGPIGIARKLAHYVKNNEKAGINYRESFQVDS